MHGEIALPERYRAALYIRLSKEDENEGPSESVTNQRALLEDFARRSHLRVHDIYIDDGWTGTNFDRPEFRRMIADIEAKKVNMVITKDLSRLGRDYILTGHYMERYFPEHRVRYLSLLDGIDTGVDSSANDITPFRAIMNDMYAKDISKKIKSVKRDKQRRGQFIGGKPVYGYRMHPTEKNRIVVDERAAAVVRQIFSLALEGLSCRKIAQRLNEAGIPPPAVYAGLAVSCRGVYTGLWSGERISELLRNETYIGNMVQGRSVKVSYKSSKCRKQPPEDWVVVADTHQPLVERDTFIKVGRLLDSRRRTRSRTYDFLLKGMIFCHECGQPLGVINRKNAAGEDVLYLICRTYQRDTRVCTSHTIKESVVRDAVMAQVERVCQSCVDEGALLAAASALVSELRGLNEAEKKRAILQGEVRRLTAQMDRVYLDGITGVLSKCDSDRILKRLGQERSMAQEKIYQIDKIAQKTQEEGLEQESRQVWEEMLRSREMLVDLVERVEVTQQRAVVLKFRFFQREKPENDLYY